MTDNRDRLEGLFEQNKVAGIDFVYVHKGLVDGRARIDVHFFELKDATAKTIVGGISKKDVEIYHETENREFSWLAIHKVRWSEDDDNVLCLTTGMPKPFLKYRLAIDSAKIDPYYNDIEFNFSAQCPSDLDCKPFEHECPPEKEIDFPVDYRARDFWSFRRALLDFASQRYPHWKDSQYEADIGVMLAEMMSALADDLAYYQDRIAREAYLETATQRRSLRQHARLVDYIIHDGLGASTWLDITVKEGENKDIQSGTCFYAASEDGRTIEYEVGRGLRDKLNEVKYNIDSKRNLFEPHVWDEDDTYLPVGTKEVFIQGQYEDDLPLDDPPDALKTSGKWVLLQTKPKDSAISQRKWVVRLTSIENARDPIFGEDITKLTWEDEQALPFEIDITTLEIRGNLVPITAGRTEEIEFMIGLKDKTADLPSALERWGPNGSTVFRFTLPDSESKGLVWLPDLKSGNFIGKEYDPESTYPEINIQEINSDGSEGENWGWVRSLIRNRVQRFDHSFSLDDGTWGRVAGYQREGKEIEHIDYKSGNGTTIRFGDGEFGAMPKRGQAFKVIYRLGNGGRGNVPAGAITNFDTEDNDLAFIEKVSNPLPVNNGIDPETPEHIRNLAPDAFRYMTFRAVRPEDYAEAAERLSWVQRAGATFRWTGSWLSAFVTPDPRGAVSITDAQRTELINQLDRYRQVGREAHMLDPCYADLDLMITVCVAPTAYRGEVKEGILEALLGKKGVNSRPGFFSPDNYTFGKPLYRSALEAEIQRVPGVRAVIKAQIRRRGWFGWRVFHEHAYGVALNEVIRIENDPAHPERGSVKLFMEGGA